MKERAVISLLVAHELFYQGSGDVIGALRRHAPARYLAYHDLLSPEGTAKWLAKWDARDVSVFNGILVSSFTVGSFEEQLLYICTPGAHVHNEGFARWWRVASVLSGRFFKERHVLRR